MLSVRKQLTQMLLEVTTNEIRDAANDAMQYMKRKGSFLNTLVLSVIFRTDFVYNNCIVSAS